MYLFLNIIIYITRIYKLLYKEDLTSLIKDLFILIEPYLAELKLRRISLFSS